MIPSSCLESPLQAYQRANSSLLGLIRGERFGSRTAAERRRRAEARLARTRALLAELGNPQHSYLTVHVTGTSGKGSTASAIASILTASGYRTGLRTSPYLQVATEKVQVDGLLIDGCAFDQLSGELLELGSRCFPSQEPGERLGYAEVWSALAYRWFAEQRVEIAVIEVGAGGRFDTTNVIDPVVSVITSVGLDHVVSLGPTLADIAWHKAGIIKPGSVAIVGELPAEALAVVAESARAVGSPVIRADAASVAEPFPLAMAGQFQQANARMAVAAARALGAHGLAIPESAIVAGLGTSRMPGRLEKMPAPALVDIWLDGAHNPDKVAALAREAAALGRTDALPVIVLGVLQAKDATAIARRLASVASALVVTEASVIGKRALTAVDLASIMSDVGFRGRIVVEPEPVVALQEAERLALASGVNVLVTGSMYLIGQVRRRWYADDAIVVQRTPWPSPDPATLLNVP